MSLSETIRAIHALACIRHFDANTETVGVVFQVTNDYATTPIPPGREAAEVCRWRAQVRLGGGEWGHNCGEGDTPEEAANALLRGYVDAHNVVNQRRKSVFERLPALK